MEKIVIIPDLHCCDHDPKAVELCCKIVEDAKPDRVIFLGDMIDYGWASNYPYNQGELKGIFTKEVAAWMDVAGQFRSAAPSARFQAMLGNHEARMYRGFLWTHPAFVDWHGLSWDNILGLGKFDIELVDYVALAHKNFMITHGVRVRGKSGASAHGELSEEWGISGLSGHTHRLAQIYRTLFRGIYCWSEGGHLQNPNPRYKPLNKIAPYDWQQGFTIMYASGREFRVPDLIPFWPKGGHLRARYADKEYTTSPRRMSTKHSSRRKAVRRVSRKAVEQRRRGRGRR